MLAMVQRLFLALAVLIAIGSVTDADNESNEFQMEHDRVVVFKDGYCLIVKNGTVRTDKNGKAFTDEVPDSAILGSFWAIPDNCQIKSMTAGFAEQKVDLSREIDCSNLGEIIAANLNRDCSFQIGERSFQGTIVKILHSNPVSPNQVELLSSFSSHDPPSRQNRRQTTIQRKIPTAESFIVRTDEGDVVVATQSVENLLIENMNSKTSETTSRTESKKRISFQFDKKDSDVKIKLMYFRPDVRWIPTYRVNLTGQESSKQLRGKTKTKVAQIALQGEIINEAEDFRDVPFHVVVGVPNFRFRNTPSPLVLESSVRNIVAQVAPNVMMNNRSQQFSNALITQTAGDFPGQRSTGSDQNGDVEMPKELTGQSGNDLYVYRLEKMSLKKGERASVPILTTEVSYRDVYTWDIDVIHSETYAADSSSGVSPLVLTKNRVWRQVELVNNTKIPWTTGAAMFVDDFQPLAQELLTYTSPGGTCRIPITVAVDLRGKVEDNEIGRDLKSLRWRGYDYAKVKGKIEIELVNQKDTSVPVEMRLRFGGRADQVSDDGKVTLSGFRKNDWQDLRGDAINNSSLIEWKAEISPGQTFKPFANYQFLLRY
ncbi:MAG: hypothetical protein AAF939_19415 [Planctomycetota bacterium]